MKWILCSLLLLSSGAQAKIYLVAAKVKFKTTATPGFLKIESEKGTAEGSLIVEDNKVAGEFKSRLANFDTGIALRNTHMRERYLDTDKYPYATFTFPSQKDDGEVEGTLTIKSETKPFKLKYTTKGEEVTATGTLNVKDYPSIGVPSYLGVTAADTVDLVIIFNFKR